VAPAGSSRPSTSIGSSRRRSEPEAGVGQLRLAGEAVEDPGESDRGRLLRRHQQRHQLVDDLLGGESCLVGHHAPEHVDLGSVFAVACVAGDLAAARFHRSRQSRHDRGLALLEERLAELAHQAVAFAGQGHRRVAGRAQHPPDRLDQLAGDLLVAHPQHQPHEDLVAEGAQAGEEPEGAAERPAGCMAHGDLRNRLAAGVDHLRREGRGDPRPPRLMVLGVAAEDRAAGGKGEDGAAGLAGMGALGVGAEQRFHSLGLGDEKGRPRGQQADLEDLAELLPLAAQELERVAVEGDGLREDVRAGPGRRLQGPGGFRDLHPQRLPCG
jgi:hypothetical protein